LGTPSYLSSATLLLVQVQKKELGSQVNGEILSLFVQYLNITYPFKVMSLIDVSEEFFVV